MPIDKDLLAAAGFIMDGMLSFSMPALAETHQEGAIGLVYEVTGYARYVERLWQVGYDYLESVEGQPTGVWPYDLVSPFGQWFGSKCLEGKEPPSAYEVRKYLVDEVLKFFSKDNSLTDEQQAELKQQLNQQAT